MNSPSPSGLEIGKIYPNAHTHFCPDGEHCILDQKKKNGLEKSDGFFIRYPVTTAVIIGGIYTTILILVEFLTR